MFAIYLKAIYICSMIAKELFKGTIRTIVLQLLAGHKKMYGYELMQTIEKKSDGKIKLTFGSLYPILHKLESEGLIYSESETIGKRVRKYYILTENGVKEKENKVLEIKEFISTLNQLFDCGGIIHA
jgi:PadR family transcriptional regulator, regulatory protein PadR